MSSEPRRHITLDLLRRRSEHNEGLVSTLEELALHQEELETIGPVLGRTCGRTLKILLLQNNCIGPTLLERETRLLMQLTYLNLALNNLTALGDRPGVLARCEFLEKLDLTLNFVDVDALEDMVDELARLRSLRELFLLGNPCMGHGDAVPCSGGPESSNDIAELAKQLQISAAPPASGGNDGQQEKQSGWNGCRPYVIARLPNLRTLDGKDVLRSERILATQQLPELEKELRQLAKAKRDAEVSNSTADTAGDGDVIEMGPDGFDASSHVPILGDDELTGHTPEVRLQIARELAEQKAEKARQDKANMPQVKGEKENEEDQKAVIDRARRREERGDIKQCNEGKWQFRFDEESQPGSVLLSIPLPKFLSSSLIDVDVHPTYVTVVIKGKVLRLVLPAEVRSEESTAQRSTTAGQIVITMPKVNENENMISIRAARRHREEKEAAARKQKVKSLVNVSASSRSLASVMMEEASKQPTGSVRIAGLVDEKNGGVKQEASFGCGIENQMKALGSMRKVVAQDDVDSADSDSDDPPPLFYFLALFLFARIFGLYRKDYERAKQLKDNYYNKLRRFATSFDTAFAPIADISIADTLDSCAFA